MNQSVLYYAGICIGFSAGLLVGYASCLISKNKKKQPCKEQ